MTDDAKETAERYFEIAEEKDPKKLTEILAEDFVYHDAPEGVPGTREGYMRIFEGYCQAMPDHTITPEFMVAEDDLVVTRWRVQGTNTGPLWVGDIPATGREVDVTGITINRVRDGRIVEQWEQADTLGILQQLGVVEAPGE